MSKKIIGSAIVAALLASTLPGIANAAVIEGSLKQKHDKNKAYCSATLSDEENAELTSRARAYATDKSAFGQAAYASVANKLGITPEELHKQHKDKGAEFAAKLGLTESEFASFIGWAGFGQRDPENYVKKYVKKYTNVDAYEDEAQKDAEELSMYESALTDESVRYQILGAEGAPSDALKELYQENADAFAKALTAYYNLKKIGVVFEKACWDSAQNQNSVNVEIPEAKTATPAETPKQDQPKADEPKQDQPKTDEPKQDEPKADEPKQDQPKQDQPKADEPKQDQPKQDQPKTDEPKQDQPKQDQPKQDQPKKDEPKETDRSSSLDIGLLPWVGIIGVLTAILIAIAPFAVAFAQGNLPPRA